MSCASLTICSGTPCSKYGYCAYDLIQYYVNNKTINSHCECGADYFTKDGDNIFCCHKRKSTFIAFLLETLISFGAGHFYSKRIALGVVKVILEIVVIIGIYLLIKMKNNKDKNFLFIYTGIKIENVHKKKGQKEEEEKALIIYKVISGLVTLIITLWILDILFIVFNVYNDGDGENLSK